MRVILLLLLFFHCLWTVNAQDDCKKTKLLVDLLLDKHIEPRTIDDTFSEDLYYQFISRLDPDLLYFTKEDESFFEKHKLSLDEYINSTNCEFLSDFSNTFKHRVEKLSVEVNTLLKNPLTYDKQESLIWKKVSGPITIEKSEQEQLEVWRKYLKNLILEKILVVSQN